jgi:hypothetical protein
MGTFCFNPSKASAYPAYERAEESGYKDKSAVAKQRVLLESLNTLVC